MENLLIDRLYIQTCRNFKHYLNKYFKKSKNLLTCFFFKIVSEKELYLHSMNGKLLIPVQIVWWSKKSNKLSKFFSIVGHTHINEYAKTETLIAELNCTKGT